MTEKQTINNREVWIKVDPHPVERSNPNVIPTEYFTAMYYLQDPQSENVAGIFVEDENGDLKLFESPVAALSQAAKILEKNI